LTPSSTKDAQSNHTIFYYDSAGRRTNTFYADAYSVTYNYDLLGRATNTTDSSGYSLTNWFVNQGLLYASSNAFGRVQAASFDVEDRATNTVDANGVSLNMTYDSLGRMLTRTNAFGGEQFGYTASGLAAYTNQLGQTNGYFYDQAMRKTAETNANGEGVQFRYDPSANLTNLVDGKGQSTWWSYDQYSRLTNKTDNLSNTLFSYGYDANNRLTGRTNATGLWAVYRYDPVGNLTNIVYSRNHAITLAYDAMNRLTNMVDAVGTTVYAYDAVGEVLSEDGPWVDDTVSFTYANRLRTGMSVLAPDAAAWTQSYTYDATRRLAAVASPAGSFAYSYKVGSTVLPGSLVQGLTLPCGAVITNSYDALARLTGTYLTNSQGAGLNLHAYGYNAASQRTRQTRLNGDYVTYTYDNIGQLKTAAGMESGGTTSRWQEQFAYGYDKAWNLNYRTNNALAQTFGVDGDNRLTTASSSGTLTVAGTTTSPATNVTVWGSTGLASGLATLYADSTWARTNATLPNGSVTYTATAQDRYLRQSTNSVTVNLPASASYTYDLNGNLLGDGNRSFAYDDENQLVSVYVTNVWESDFVYDGKMRLRERFESVWAGGTRVTNAVTLYVYDGNVVVQERNANNLPRVAYTRGSDLSGTLEGAGGIGGLLARTDLSTLITQPSTAHAYYHADGNGNINCLINSQQSVMARYLYDPFGNTLSQSGPLAAANLYRFSSKEFHVSSGLVYYLYRFYDPNFQRWPNRDPLGDDGSLVYAIDRIEPRLEARSAAERAMMVQQFGDPLSAITQVNLNLSLFVANNPMANVDPRGLDWLSCMANCVQAHDPVNNLGKACGTFLGGTFPKRWAPAGGGLGGGGSRVTTVLSRISVGKGTAAAGGNVARIVGRIFSPVWVIYGLSLAGVEAACAGTCTGDPTAY
jgi:RHS repeat-associated protein